jgi:uncharacterized glyoxalase superfamily protein PhnB
VAGFARHRDRRRLACSFDRQGRAAVAGRATGTVAIPSRRAHGLRRPWPLSWNGFGGAMTATITFGRVIPILRIFDLAKADAFYLEYLGFQVDWDHRFDDNAPLYRQISRGDLILHLSEHHGDGSPGAHLRVTMRGVEAFHQELAAKNYRYMRPGLETTPWKTREISVIDPFGNLICFSEPIDDSKAE